MAIRKCIRWTPIKPDPTGSMRESDSRLFDGLNRQVMGALHVHALKINERLSNWRRP